MNDRKFFWLIAGSAFTGLASLSIAAPAVYVLTMAMIACVGVLAATAVGTFVLLDSGPFGWIAAGDLFRVGLEIAVAIMRAAAGASSND
ncbi:MAG TPA: hypothetical protein VFE62_06830 [Gemmataceae bacterium]|nr:hypothetical protein [Gemmataceae bacterium]